MAKTLKTRIALRYDTLSNWNTHNPTLIAGEVAVVAIPEEGSSNPSLRLKVGDGTRPFKSLPWIEEKALKDYVTETELTTILSGYYTKTEIDTTVGEIPSTVVVGQDAQGHDIVRNTNSVVAYVNAKAEETLNAASGGSSESAASVLAALNTYKSENDAKVTANTNSISAIKDGTTIDSFKDVEDSLANKANSSDIKTYSITKDTTSSDYAAVYHLTENGTNVGVAINIPKDLVVQSGSVIEKNGEKYIQLVLANSSTPIEIKVTDLVDEYTAGDNISITNRAISVTGVYTQEQVNTLLDAKVNTSALSSYYTKTEADTQFEENLEYVYILCGDSATDNTNLPNVANTWA